MTKVESYIAQGILTPTGVDFEQVPSLTPYITMVGIGDSDGTDIPKPDRPFPDFDVFDIEVKRTDIISSEPTDQIDHDITSGWDNIQMSATITTTLPTVMEMDDAVAEFFVHNYVLWYWSSDEVIKDVQLVSTHADASGNIVLDFSLTVATGSSMFSIDVEDKYNKNITINVFEK